MTVYSLCAKPVVLKVGVGPPVGEVGGRHRSNAGPPCSEAVDDQGKNVE